MGDWLQFMALPVVERCLIGRRRGGRHTFAELQLNDDNEEVMLAYLGVAVLLSVWGGLVASLLTMTAAVVCLTRARTDNRYSGL